MQFGCEYLKEPELKACLEEGKEACKDVMKKDCGALAKG